MKRTLLLSIAASTILMASADLNGPGYYRVHNYKSGRYVSVIDNRGRIDYTNTTADLQAIKLQKDMDEVCSDPASVLYIYGKGGTQYQIEAQGTGIYQIISHYLNLKPVGKSGSATLYNAYGEMNGVIKYIGDTNFILSQDLGRMDTHAMNDFKKWLITPISSEGDNYFGIKPTFEINGKYYTAMYTQFPYTPKSQGMKVYYLKDHWNGMLLAEEIKGTVPAGTPVWIECSSPDATNNRVEVGGSATKLAKNSLKGVYFNCSVSNSHINRKAYDKETMRVLGKCADGSLGFIQDATLEYLPANSCYITVYPESPAEYKFVSPSEFEAGIDDITDSEIISGNTVDVYNMQGIKVLHNVRIEEIYSLPAGLYIANGKKYQVH